jgi:putative methyltransferase (TIGR04325 family)
MRWLQQLLPPVIWEFLYQSRFRPYGWFGNYVSWKEAEANSEGYSSSSIIEKVKDATLKVKDGRAVYERDSVLFDKIEYDWPVLAGLLWVAAQDNGNLNVVDFGGSLGSSYWQNRRFLNSLPSVKWNIIEQPAFVECGRQLFEDERIRFYNDFPSCLSNNKPNVVLLSSVLSYIREPYELLSFIAQFNIQFLIIDRLLTVSAPTDRLTVQKVPPHIYKASYPAWFFSYEKVRGFIEGYFEIVEEYECNIRVNIPSAKLEGFILRTRATRN